MRSGVGDDCKTWSVVGWECHCLRVKIQNNLMHIKPNVQLRLYTSSSGVYAVCCKAISESKLALNSSSFVAFVTAIGSRFHSCIVRGKKDCLYAAILVWCCISLLALLVLESLVWTIFDDSGIQTKPCITFFIIMSLWLFRRSFRRSHPNDFTIAVMHPGVLSL